MLMSIMFIIIYKFVTNETSLFKLVYKRVFVTIDQVLAATTITATVIMMVSTTSLSSGFICLRISLEIDRAGCICLPSLSIKGLWS